jgi:hypothetical protein
VNDARGRFPERVQEWDVYLGQLRELAGPGGEIPARFDGLVWDVFDEIV